MKTILQITLASALILCATGCAQVTEFGKKMWGTSTQALEEARVDAAKRTFACSLDDCFDAVIGLTVADPEETDDLETPRQTLDLFFSNPKKRHIVLMGIPGSVNTTEVGVFFVPLEGSQIQIEVSSLSTGAKITASELIFAELAKQFQEVR